MDKFLSRQLAKEATLVVDDGLAAIQLEAHLAHGADSSKPNVWVTPPIETRETWAAATWSAQAAPERLVLQGSQSAALWRRIIDESPAGGALIDTRRVAVWASDAWRRLVEWQLDFRELRAREENPGFESFLSWAGRYRDTLATSGWMDPAELGPALTRAAEAGRLACGSLVWADLASRTPAFESLSAALSEAGWGVAGWEPARVSKSVRRLALEDSREELRSAVFWACAKLAREPGLRIALVVPARADSDLQLARCLDAVSADAAVDVARLDERGCEREPLVGAALDCLELLSRHADFYTFGRWLRSPFVGRAMEGLAARSLIEAELRGELTSQLGFLAAYRSAGLAGWLSRRAPLLSAALQGVMGRLGGLPRYQSPTRWARFAEDILDGLGWPGPAGPPPTHVLDAWNGALTDLCRLTPVLGAIDFERALGEIKAALARARRPRRFPVTGITLLSRLEQLGPGYDAAWISGMSDRAWPRPAQLNPLLPVALQVAQRMPYATPADALQRCRQLTERLIARVPELVFSYPLSENDVAAEPSPLLREIKTLEAGSAPCGRPAYASPPRPQSLECLDDPVPPLVGAVVTGGAATLAAQARCPLRAFLEGRLGARPLDRVCRGISPRLRGILTHRALELLLANRPSRDELRRWSATALDGRVQVCIRRAIAERARGATRALAAHLQLERDRLAPLIAGLVRADCERGEFAVESLEAEHAVEIAGLRIGCRIDRIDRLGSGALAIIDYKTGQRAAPADWFKSRLVEPQLPLYLQVVTEAVGAIVFGAIQASGFSYRGLWVEPETFPGRSQRLPRGLDLPAQRARWSEQLEQLAREFARGDARIFLADRDAAEGDFAPLTRIFEQTALSRGWLPAGSP